MKKASFIILVLLVLGGAGFVSRHYHRSKAPVVAPVVTPAPKPVPVKSESVPVPEPAVTSGYVIGVISVSKSINGESISLRVVNDGDTTLQLLPDEQFKLAGLTSQAVRVPIAGKTTPEMKGTLDKNATLSGTVTFDTFVEEQSELRFYPDPALQTYIVVPLIPLPDGQ